MRWPVTRYLARPGGWLPRAWLLAWCCAPAVSWAAPTWQASDAWQVWLDQDGVLQGYGFTIMQQELLQRSQDELRQRLQAPPLFTTLALHDERLLALRPDGSVYGFGDNATGGLGQSVAEHRVRPIAPQERRFSPWVEPLRLVYGVLGARQLALGGGHSLAVLEDGALCAWGFGDAGQLGVKPPRRPLANVQLDPRKVAGLPPLSAAAAGDGHSMALDSQGQVWTWGLNSMGQLGDGTLENRYHPRAIAGLDRITALAAGAIHSLALDSHGRVWSWGANTYGQLGRPTGRHDFARKPLPVAGLPAVTALAAAGDVSAALGRDGAVWWWGGHLERNVALRSTPWELQRLQGVGRAVSLAAFTRGLVIVDEQGKVWLFAQPYEHPPRRLR